MGPTVLADSYVVDGDRLTMQFEADDEELRLGFYRENDPLHLVRAKPGDRRDLEYVGAPEGDRAMRRWRCRSLWPRGSRLGRPLSISRSPQGKSHLNRLIGNPHPPHSLRSDFMSERMPILMLAFLVVASCGDSDKSTGPEQSPLVGTWTLPEERGEFLGLEGDATVTFEDDGTMTLKIGTSSVSIVVSGIWSVAGNRLTLGIRGGVFSYEIRGGELTFATVEAGTSSLADWDFQTDGDPGGVLTGVTWVDEDEDELVFYSDGTYRWGEDYEEGTWTAEDGTITVYETSSFSYVVSGTTLTLIERDGEITILTKE